MWQGWANHFCFAAGPLQNATFSGGPFFLTEIEASVG